MKNIIYAVLFFAIGSFVTIGLIRQEYKTQPEAPFHEHADFGVFINGVQFDFSQEKYMTEATCNVTYKKSFIDRVFAHGSDLDPDLAGSVHLHDGNGSVVHVHKEKITWGDFFESMHMTLADNGLIDDEKKEYLNSPTREWVFVVNGKKVEKLSSMEIRNFDRVLLSYGKKNRSEFELMSEYGKISNGACEQSGGCEFRGADYIESCGVNEVTPWLLNIIGVK